MGWPSSVDDSVVTTPKFYNHGIWSDVSDATAFATASQETDDRLIQERVIRRVSNYAMQ